MEIIMAEQSSMHFYLNWAKERIDEMDAALASFEVKAGQAKADSKVKADQIVADLKKRRDEFQAQLKTQTEAGEAAWAREDRYGKAVEWLRSTGPDLLRKRGQAGRAAAGDLQGDRRGASEGLARVGG
jgi:hypothetical protein